MEIVILMPGIAAAVDSGGGNDEVSRGGCGSLVRAVALSTRRRRCRQRRTLSSRFFDPRSRWMNGFPRRPAPGNVNHIVRMGR